MNKNTKVAMAFVAAALITGNLPAGTISTFLMLVVFVAFWVTIAVVLVNSAAGLFSKYLEG